MTIALSVIAACEVFRAYIVFTAAQSKGKLHPVRSLRKRGRKPHPLRVTERP